MQELERRFEIGDMWANLASVILAKVVFVSKPKIGVRIHVDDRFLWAKTIN